MRQIYHLVIDNADADKFSKAMMFITKDRDNDDVARILDSFEEKNTRCYVSLTKYELLLIRLYCNIIDVTAIHTTEGNISCQTN